MIFRNLTIKLPLFLLINFICGVCVLVQPQIKADTNLSKEKEVKTTITYCNLNLSEQWKLANLSFNSLYSFTINEKGEADNIEKVRDDFIGEEEVKSCVSKWKIKGFPKESRFSVYFVWKHGKGWIRQEISGNGFMQTMMMEDFGVEKLIKSEMSINNKQSNSIKMP